MVLKVKSKQTKIKSISAAQCHAQTHPNPQTLTNTVSFHTNPPHPTHMHNITKIAPCHNKLTLTISFEHTNVKERTRKARSTSVDREITFPNTKHFGPRRLSQTKKGNNRKQKRYVYKQTKKDIITKTVGAVFEDTSVRVLRLRLQRRELYCDVPAAVGLQLHLHQIRDTLFTRGDGSIRSAIRRAIALTLIF